MNISYTPTSLEIIRGISTIYNYFLSSPSTSTQVPITPNNAQQNTEATTTNTTNFSINLFGAVDMKFNNIQTTSTKAISMPNSPKKPQNDAKKRGSKSCETTPRKNSTPYNSRRHVVSNEIGKNSKKFERNSKNFNIVLRLDDYTNYLNLNMIYDLTKSKVNRLLSKNQGFG